MKKSLLTTFLVLGMSKEPSETYSCDLQKIDQLAPQEIDTLVNDLDKIKAQLEGFRIGGYTRAIYILGQTGAGKSTLINYLLKAKMNYDGSPYSCSINPTNQNQFDQLPKIGNGANSETRRPDIFYDWQLPAAYIDTPGFFNNKSDKKEEIKESYSNSLIFRKGQKINILLVVDVNQILSTKGDDLFSVVRQISQLFPNQFLSISESTTIVLSKVRPDMKKQDCIKRIKFLIQNRENLRDEQKFFFKEIISQNNIILFNTPDTLDEEQIDRIKTEIRKKPGKVLKQNAKMYLNPEIRQLSLRFAQGINSYLKCLTKQISQAIKSKYIQRKYASSTEIMNSSADLYQIWTLIDMHPKLLTRKNQLNDFLTKVGIYTQKLSNQFLENIKRISFCNFLNEQISVEEPYVKLKEQIFNKKEQLSQLLRLQLQQEEKSKEQIKETMKKMDLFYKQLRLRFQSMEEQIRRERKQWNMRQQDQARREKQRQQYYKKKEEQAQKKWKQYYQNQKKKQQQNGVCSLM